MVISQKLFRLLDLIRVSLEGDQELARFDL